MFSDKSAESVSSDGFFKKESKEYMNVFSYILFI